MAHTTEVDSWDYDDDYDDNADALEAMEVASLQELYDEPGTITIEVESGVVTAVRGLPDDCQYKIVVHNSECITREEPNPEALYLATVNILVRATSPDRAHDAIHRNILNEHDTDASTLVDWDYAVQDGERQLPKCVSLDLEPESITELLDRMATQGE